MLASTHGPPAGCWPSSSSPTGRRPDTSTTSWLPCATGKTAVVQGSISVPLTQTANVDGGTLAFSSDYEAADYEVIVDAFDVTQEPPADWYHVADARIRAVTIRYEDGKFRRNFSLVRALRDQQQAGTS